MITHRKIQKVFNHMIIQGNKFTMTYDPDYPYYFVSDGIEPASLDGLNRFSAYCFNKECDEEEHWYDFAIFAEDLLKTIVKYKIEPYYE